MADGNISSSAGETSNNHNEVKGSGNKKSSYFSTTCFSSAFMVLYLFLTGSNLYRLMYPLAFLDLTPYSEESFVKPLWETGTPMDMTIYLSKSDRFHKAFLRSEFVNKPNHGDENDDEGNDKMDDSSLETVMLWKEEIAAPSLSKSFLITSREENASDGSGDSIEDDASFLYAQRWLDDMEKSLLETDGGILSTISAAGHGIESTSVLLTMYQSLSRQVGKILGFSRQVDDNETGAALRTKGLLERSVIRLPSTSPIWSAIMSNSTMYIHVVVMRRAKGSASYRPTSADEAAQMIGQASRSHSVLLGQVDLVKYDAPNHLSKPGRILYHDLVYLVQKYILRSKEFLDQRPPWDMEYSKPEYFKAYQTALNMKESGEGYPYWKPEVAVKYLIDEDSYPIDFAHVSGMQLVRTNSRSQQHPTGIAHLPALHVDEIGLTSEKYIPINKTVTSLPLRITMDRSDMKHERHHSTATEGGISPARWRLLSHLSESIEAQKQLGFEQSDIDDLRRLIADTNITLLSITMLASALHLLFEFLTFKSEVSFWRNNKDLTGLSVRSLFFDFFGQVIILLFLIEKDSSLLMTIPTAFGCLIALWKCHRAAGFALVRVSGGLFGYALKATRLEVKSKAGTMEDNSAADTVDLHELTMESDRIATSTLGSLLLPCVIAYAAYSLLQEEHTGWYSWLITSASSAVYALGFVLMTPQLFLNYKLKSVAHLPWRVLIYRSLNTFIDDLFSFIIRMPTMARISCFRDDVVFIVYLYQRWLYPVDTSRPVEGGEAGVSDEILNDNMGKKNRTTVSSAATKTDMKNADGAKTGKGGSANKMKKTQ